MQYGSIVKIGQVGHILGFFVFWRVHLRDLLFLEVLFLYAEGKTGISTDGNGTYVNQFRVVALL